LVVVLTAGTIGMGVLVWKWDARSLVLLYWLENVMIGGLQVAKMLMTRSSLSGSRWAWLLRLGLCGFFLVHYGGFCAGHGFFLLVIGGQERAGVLSDMNLFFGPLVFVHLLWLVLHEVLQVLPASAYISLLGLFAGRVVSLINDRQRWRHQGVSELMKEPYKYIVVVHLAILLGAALAMIWSNPWPVLLLIVAGKLWLDLREIWGISLRNFFADQSNERNYAQK
jgi:hypothetical protein